jgi:hypothetical protein
MCLLSHSGVSRTFLSVDFYETGKHSFWCNILETCLSLVYDKFETLNRGWDSLPAEYDHLQYYYW